MRELSLNVMDIVQNSVSAGATLIRINVTESVTRDILTISVIDNGCGMTPEQTASVIDPFYTTRTTRKVGLGVPLFKMEAEMTGGNFEIQSEKGKGTVLSATFKPSSVDMIPLGDINGTVKLLISCNPQIDFVFTRSFESNGKEREMYLDTRELREILGEVSLNSPDVVVWITEYLEEQTTELLKPET